MLAVMTSLVGCGTSADCLLQVNSCRSRFIPMRQISGGDVIISALVPIGPGSASDWCLHHCLGLVRLLAAACLATDVSVRIQIGHLTGPAV